MSSDICGKGARFRAYIVLEEFWSLLPLVQKSSSPHEARAFKELRRYHTRPSQFNWGPKNVDFGETPFSDLNIDAKIFFWLFTKFYRDQGQNQKYDGTGTGTKTGTRIRMEPGPGSGLVRDQRPGPVLVRDRNWDRDQERVRDWDHDQEWVKDL